jgi:hypothetical protein
MLPKRPQFCFTTWNLYFPGGYDQNANRVFYFDEAPWAQDEGQSRLAEMARQIIEEIFHAKSLDVEEMIQMRLEEKSWDKKSWQEE